MTILNINGSLVRHASQWRSVMDDLLSGAANQQAEGAAPTLLLVSALGETDNLLSELTHSFFDQDEGSTTYANHYLDQVRSFHLNLVQELNLADSPYLVDTLSNFLVEIEWILEDGPVDAFDYTLDQIMAVGPLLASTIASAYLQMKGVSNTWVDARNIFVTDNRYGQARIDEAKSQQLIQTGIKPLLTKAWVVAPAGIGTTTENFSTLLGQTGTAASIKLVADTLGATISTREV